MGSLRFPIWSNEDEVYFDDEDSLLRECYKSTATCGRVLFTQTCYRPYTSIMKELFHAIDHPYINNVLVMAPRGYGKTTTLSKILPARHILFRSKKYIVPISATNSVAVRFSEGLKHNLLTTPIVQKLWPQLKTNLFSQEIWQTSLGASVMPRGAGQQIRGLNVNDARPDLIIGDDIETSEGVKNPDQRMKLEDWWFDDVMNSMAEDNTSRKVILGGTLLSDASLLAKVSELPDWHVIQIKICDENFDPTWPEYMSKEAILAKYEQYKRRGKLDSFYREYMQEAMSMEDAVFLPDKFKYVGLKNRVLQLPDGEQLPLRKLRVVTVVDPAKTQKMQSAFSAFVTIAFDMENHRIFICNVRTEKVRPAELYSIAFSEALEYQADVIAVEDTGLNDFIRQPFQSASISRGLNWISFLWLNAVGKKLDRIGALASYYALGHIYHVKDNCLPLEQQLLRFPNGKYVDAADATAYIPKIMDKLNLDFMFKDEEAFNANLHTYDSDELQQLNQIGWI